MRAFGDARLRARQRIPAADLRRGRGDGPAVVLADEQQRERPGGGEVQGLEHHPLVRGAVAEERDRHGPGPQRTRGEREPRAEGSGRSDDPRRRGEVRARHEVHVAGAAGQKRAQGHIQRLIGAQKRVIHVQIAAAAANVLQEGLELALISPPQRPWFGHLFGQTFQPFEKSRILERKVLFGGVDHLQRGDLLADELGDLVCFDLRHNVSSQFSDRPSSYQLPATSYSVLASTSPVDP